MTLRRASLSLIGLIGLTLALMPYGSVWAADGPGGSGSGSLGSSGVGSTAGAPGGSGSISVSYTPPPPNPPPLGSSGYTWTDVGADLNAHCINGQASQGPPVTGANGAGTGESLGPPGLSGYPDLYVLVGPDGETVETSDVCPTKAAPTVPAPPSPPSPGQVWALTPLPVPVFHFNPSTVGLTQLPTLFWLTGVGGQVRATVTIRGYTVTTTARPVDYYWYFGDGGSAESASPGSASVPAATHTYVTKADYTVEVIVGWSGSYTFTGNGVPAETVALGTVDGPTAAAAYGVQEVRAVGTP